MNIERLVSCLRSILSDYVHIMLYKVLTDQPPVQQARLWIMIIITKVVLNYDNYGRRAQSSNNWIMKIQIIRLIIYDMW